MGIKEGLMGMVKGNPVSGIGVGGALANGHWNPLTGLLGDILGGHHKDEADKEEPNPGQKMFGMDADNRSGDKPDFGHRLMDSLLRSAIGGFR